MSRVAALASIIRDHDAPDLTYLTEFAARRRQQNPPPGQPGHDHWADKRPPGVPRDLWAAYGDRYPGSYCRWLSQQAEREWHRRGAALREGGAA